MTKTKNDAAYTLKCDVVVAECALDKTHRRERESVAGRVQRRLEIHVGHCELERCRQPRALHTALEHAACVQQSHRPLESIRTSEIEAVTNARLSIDGTHQLGQ